MVQMESYYGMEVSAEGWRHAPIILPLGVNRKTGTKCLFMNFEGSLCDDQLECFAKIRAVKIQDIRSIISRLRGGKQIPLPVSGGIEPSAAATLIKSCPVAAEIIKKARAGRRLSEQEKMFIYYTLGFAGDRGVSLHFALEMSPDYRPEKTDRLLAQLRPNPVSCPKIRELLPEITAYVGCDCALPVPDGGYPSPLIHIDPKLVQGKRRHYVNEQTPLQEMARRYICAHREMQEIVKTMQVIENRIKAELYKKGATDVSTPFGRVALKDNQLSVG